MGLLLGLDLGTGGVRVGAYDLDARRMVAEREAEYATRHPHPGWAEQSPVDWWDALGQASRGLMRDLGTPEIAGVCAATTASTVVACGADGAPLRPALLWMDCRAAAESDATVRSRHPVLRYSGGGDAAEWLVPKAMWLAAHEPAIYGRAAIICECLDWINFRLTGRWVGSRMNATCKWNFDSVAGRFHDDLFAELGVPDLAARLPQPILPVGAAVERIGAGAALHLGIPNRPVVAQGGIDAHIGMVGADTTEPGELLMIGGTSVVHLFQLSAERPVTGFWGPYPHALVDDRWLVEAGQVSAGSVLSWFSREIFALDAAGHDELCEAAGRIPVGRSGLLALDYFMGNRTPDRDPHLRGAVLGLSLGHDRASLYHAAVEGVALASANVIRRMDDLGIDCRRIVTSGGYARNPLWLKATVDAIGRPVELPSKTNLTVIGAAACAAAGAGFVPDLKAHARYRELLEDYLEARELLALLSRRLAVRQKGERRS